MPTLHAIQLHPVPAGSSDAVLEIVIRFMGPEQEAAARLIVAEGGRVLGGLNESAANHAAEILRNAGAQVDIVVSEQQESRHLFHVRLVSSGEEKIRVIKVVREWTGLALSEVRKLVDELGVVAEGLPEKPAHDLKKKLEEAGATVALEPLGDKSDRDSSGAFIVQGKVVLAEGKPGTGLIVRAYDKDLRSRELLGESGTDKKGAYRITYSREDFRQAELHAADLEMAVFNETGSQLGITSNPEGTLFQAGREETIDISVLASEPATPAEVQRLTHLLRPLLNGASLAGLSPEEGRFLQKESEIASLTDEFPAGEKSISFLIAAHFHERATEINASVFYGWAREGLSILDEETGQPDLETLLQEEDNILRDKLSNAAKKNIIPPVTSEEWSVVLSLLTLRRLENKDVTDRKITGKIIRKSDQQPLAGFKVTARDKKTETILSASYADTSGLFHLTYLSAASGEGADRNLILQVWDESENILASKQVSKGVDEQHLITVSVPEQAAPAMPGSDFPLDRLGEIEELDMPNGLTAALEQAGAASLADIRNLDGQGKLDELETRFGEKPLQLLKAHANLSVVTSDIGTAAKLIGKGYDNLLKITALHPDQFAADLTGTVDPSASYKIAYNAAGTVALLDAAMTGLTVDSIRRGKNADLAGILPELLLPFLPPNKCSCGCNDALSPAAYLADLLDYLTTHLQLNGPEKLTLSYLHTRFHQPFHKYPNDCTYMKTPVRTVRISIEVLRSYIAANPPAQGARTVQSATTVYLHNVFTQLLEQLGTSAGEIRHAKHNLQTKAALSARLAISESQLENGMLTLEEHTLTELQLETIFGIPQTTDPLASAPVQPEFLNWQYDHLHEQWKKDDHPTNAEGNPFPLIDPDLLDGSDLVHPGPTRSILNARRQFVNTAHNRFASKPKSKAGLGQILQDAYSATATSLRNIQRVYEDGTDVTDELNQHNLSLHGLRLLISFADLLDDGQHLPQEEWEQVYALAVAAEKQKVSGEWIEEEKRAGIVLSPRYFNDRNKDPIAPGDDAFSRWRYNSGKQRAWQTMLRSRTEQLGALKEGLKKAVELAGDRTMTEFRDTLIDLSKAKGVSVEDKAEWLTRQLQVDFRTSACTTTTRLAQAIETLQNLVFSIRTGQLDRDEASFGPLPATFDTDWHWLGTYANWRAAAAISLYPENALYPALRTGKTPAFRSLIAGLHQVPTPSPTHIRQAAETYRTYFSDVCTLIAEASCWVDTPPDSPEPLPAGKRVLLNFARSGGPDGGKLYWCTYDPGAEDTDFAPTYWHLLPGAAADGTLIGTNVYQQPGHDPLICLFFLTFNSATQSHELGLRCYGLTELGRDKPLYPLELPPGTRSIRAVVVQRTGRFDPPRLLITDQDSSSLYQRSLNATATDWEAGNWQLLYSERQTIVDTNTRVSFHSGGGNLVISGYITIRKLSLPYAYTVFDKHTTIPEDFSPVVVAAFVDPLRPAVTRILIHSGKQLFTIDSQINVSRERTLNRLLPEHVSLSHLSAHERNNFSFWDPDQFMVLDLSFQGSAMRLTIVSKATIGSSPATHILGTANGQVYYYTRTQSTSTRPIKRAPVDRLSSSENFGNTLLYIPPTDGAKASDPLPYLEYVGNKIGIFAGIFSKENIRKQTTLIPLQVEHYAITDIRSGGMNSKDRNIAVQLAYFFNIANREARRIPWIQIDYLLEAYYFVPLHFARTLEESGYFSEALDWYRTVYDYHAPDAAGRAVHPFFPLEPRATESARLSRPDDWFLDPLNPHVIASTRKHSYLRYTLQAVARCLIAYADESFTQDTSESLARARTLYRTALDLLSDEALGQHDKGCATLIVDILNAVDDPVKRRLYERLLSPAFATASTEEMKVLAEKVVSIHADNSLDEETKIENITSAVRENTATEKRLTFNELSQARSTSRLRSFELLSANRHFTPVLKFTPPLFRGYVPATQFGFCIPSNPVPDTLRRHADLSLEKLRNCRNIAGLYREIPPYAETADNTIQTGMPREATTRGISGYAHPPTLYRYNVLMGRARELAAIAQQVETSYLSAMQSRDVEIYNRLKTQQDIQLSRAGVRLQDLRLAQAEAGVVLSELQLERTGIQIDHYDSLIRGGLLSAESLAVKAMIASAGFSTAASVAYGVAGGQDLLKSFFTLGLAGNAGQHIAASLSSLASAASTSSSLFATHASYERRQQEWLFARRLAGKDFHIGRQEVNMSRRAVSLTSQERDIARMQTEHAETLSDYFANKELNADLYQWMSGELRRIYAFFLQHATATARLAEQQLAFERQEGLPGFIGTDYWNSSADYGSPGNEARLGLNGSARLLQDLTRLDQHAFETLHRKQQLEISFSLAQADPVAFQLFRRTGVLPFHTPMSLFDSRFPGQYLRLIRQVRTTVIALVPPVEGISATLTSLGISRVVTKNNTFQETVIRRQPELVSFTSPAGASGIVDLRPDPDMLLPFEGNGVDTSWEFRMPRAANALDYNSIADVVITIGYTALHDPQYGEHIRQSLPRAVLADRSYSFRQHFADAWYDLHNPELTATPMSVQFRTFAHDFPPNSREPVVTQLLVYLITDEPLTEELDLQLQLDNGLSTRQGTARTIGGLVSTRRGNGSGWIDMLGNSPEGVWTLALPDQPSVRELFGSEKIRDILFVISHSGQAEPWE